MNKIVINTPIWKDRSVGIKQDLGRDDIEMEISYKDKFGNRLYPETYCMTKEELKTYPVRTFGNTPKLIIVPIAHFKIKEKIILTEDQKLENEYLEAHGLPKKY